MRILEEKEKGLSLEQAQDCVRQGSRRQSDGRWTWKFDPQLYVGMLNEWSPPEVEALWSNIACPIMLMMGEDSWGYDIQMVERTAVFRDARVEMIAKAGHWTHLNQPRKVLETILGFLSEKPAKVR